MRAMSGQTDDSFLPHLLPLSGLTPKGPKCRPPSDYNRTMLQHVIDALCTADFKVNPNPNPNPNPRPNPNPNPNPTPEPEP